MHHLWPRLSWLLQSFTTLEMVKQILSSCVSCSQCLHACDQRQSSNAVTVCNLSIGKMFTFICAGAESTAVPSHAAEDEADGHQQATASARRSWKSCRCARCSRAHILPTIASWLTFLSLRHGARSASANGPCLMPSHAGSHKVAMASVRTAWRNSLQRAHRSMHTTSPFVRAWIQ